MRACRHAVRRPSSLGHCRSLLQFKTSGCRRPRADQWGERTRLDVYRALASCMRIGLMARPEQGSHNGGPPLWAPSWNTSKCCAKTGTDTLHKVSTDSCRRLVALGGEVDGRGVVWRGAPWARSRPVPIFEATPQANCLRAKKCGARATEANPDPLFNSLALLSGWLVAISTQTSTTRTSPVQLLGNPRTAICGWRPPRLIGKCRRILVSNVCLNVMHHDRINAQSIGRG